MLTWMTMTRPMITVTYEIVLRDDMNSCLESGMRVPRMTRELLKMLLQRMGSCLVTARMTNIQMAAPPTRQIQMAHILQVS